MKEQEKKLEWYNNPNLITWLIIGMISLIILSSQSLSTFGEINAIKMVQNILNHNITYMIMLVYFISLQTKFGKKYFDYSNVLMILFFIIIFVTSILTVFQSFSLIPIITLFNNFLILIYFFHTFFRGTRFWKEFKLNNSPFNELANEWYFNAIMVVEITLYAVSLISMTTVDGTFLATFDCIYIILFARYIYLYGVYLDYKKINCNNKGNFDEYREKILDIRDDIVEKTTKIIDDINIDEKIDDKVDELAVKFDNVVDTVKEKIDDIKKEEVVSVSEKKNVSKKNIEDKYEARKNIEKKKDNKDDSS